MFTMLIRLLLYVNNRQVLDYFTETSCATTGDTCVTNAFCTKVGTKVCTCNVGFEVSIGACTAVSGNESIVINLYS